MRENKKTYCSYCNVPIREGSYKFHKRTTFHKKVYNIITDAINSVYQNEIERNPMDTDWVEKISTQYPWLTFKTTHISNWKSLELVHRLVETYPMIRFLCSIDGRTLFNQYLPGPAGPSSYEVYRRLLRLGPYVMFGVDYITTGDSIEEFKNKVEYRLINSQPPEQVSKVLLN